MTDINNNEQVNTTSIADKLTGNVKTLNFKRGIDWISEGYDLFAKNIWLWIATCVGLFLVSIALSSIPFVGSIIASILWSGVYLVCHQTDKGEQFNLSVILTVFKHSGLKLIGLNLVNFTFIICIFGVLLQDYFGMTEAQLQNLPPEQAIELIKNVGIGLIIYLLPAAMFVFSPILVTLQKDLSMINAMQLSFKACVKNMLSFTAFGLVMSLLGILAMLPMMLGFVLLIPLSLCAIYCAYKNLFCEIDSTESHFELPNNDPQDTMEA